jgi:formylmethanofuran dehydrogenase subunit E
MWKKYSAGDRSPEVTSAVQDRKAIKMRSVLEADDADLFEVKKIKVEMPGPARIYKSLACAKCGEKVMEPRARKVGGQVLCIPCSPEEA